MIVSPIPTDLVQLTAWFVAHSVSVGDGLILRGNNLLRIVSGAEVEPPAGAAAAYASYVESIPTYTPSYPGLTPRDNTIPADANTAGVHRAIGPNAAGWGQVQTNEIANLAVTAAKIAALAIAGTMIQDNAVTSSKLQTQAVTAGKIDLGAVGTNEIAADAVVTSKIANTAVSTAKLALLAVTAAQLAADAVTTAKILDANITTAKLAANAVTQLLHQTLTSTVTLTAASAPIPATALTETLTIVSGGGDLYIEAWASVYAGTAGMNAQLHVTLFASNGTTVILAGSDALITLNHSGVYYQIMASLHVPASQPLTSGTTYIAKAMLGSPNATGSQTLSFSGNNGKLTAIEGKK